MICPVVAYAPTAATKPIIADQPLNLSASGVMIVSSLIIVNCDLNFIGCPMCNLCNKIVTSLES